MREDRSLHSPPGDGHRSVPFEEEKPTRTSSDRHYEGPLQNAVYSPPPIFGSEQLVGESQALVQLTNLIDAAARNEQNVLIQGETGTGKSLVARTIHARSDRSRHWLIVVNCAVLDAGALKPILLDPYDPSSKGVFEAAPGATVVLDHVDQLDFDSQAHLDHILETHSFACSPKSGSTHFDIRLIFVSTRPLPRETFKRDLYYRLNQFPIRVPPLRDRPEDIVPLARHFLHQQSPNPQSEENHSLSRGAKYVLRQHDWPGNVRELRNAIARAGIVSDTPTVEQSDLPPSVRRPETSVLEGNVSDSPSGTGRSDDDPDASPPFFLETDGPIPEIEELKREAVKYAYDRCDGDIDRAAVELGIARSTMYRLLDRYDLN